MEKGITILNENGILRAYASKNLSYDFLTECFKLYRWQELIFID